jgi:hypothetical protein
MISPRQLGYLLAAGLKAAEASLGLDSLWQSYSLQDMQAIDAEGRCVITDHGHFVLFNIYGPAITDASTAEQRMQYKLMFYEVRCKGGGARGCAWAG